MSKEILHKLFDDNQPNTPMSEDESKFFMGMILSKDPVYNTDFNFIGKDSEIYKHFKPVFEAFQVQVFLKRLEVLTSLRISLGALIMIAMQLESAGNAVMYAYYLNYKRQPHTLITIDVFARELFPWGTFSPEQLNAIWAGQKDGSKNLIDNLET